MSTAERKKIADISLIIKVLTFNGTGPGGEVVVEEVWNNVVSDDGGALLGSAGRHLTLLHHCNYTTL